MITPVRREVLRGLESLLDLSSPDIRMGQLVDWLGVLSEDTGGRGLGDIEDDELLVVIESLQNDLKGVSDNVESL